jgi:hypothetical protein
MPSVLGGKHLQDVASILSSRQADLDFAYLERWIHALDLLREWDRAKAAAGSIP